MERAMSEENVAIMVAELIGEEIVVVANGAAGARSVQAPDEASKARVASKLEAAGWRPEGD